MNKKILIALFFIVFVVSIYGRPAGEFSYGEFSCIERDGTIVITEYNGNGIDVIIPETINGLPVVGIGISSHGVFRYKGLTSVTIPNGVTTIGARAFRGNQLTSVDIPDSVTYIGEYAFGSNMNLTEINVSSGNTAYCSVNGVLYDKNQTTLILWPAKKTPVTIPSFVTTIGTHAFENNQLTSVIIPDSVTTIEDNAFSLNRLTGVTIPNSVTTIGASAFCLNRLTSVTIPNSVTSIGNYAFALNQLTSVTIPNSVTSIGNHVFFYNKLTSVTIPNGVTSIGFRAFENNQLTRVTIPGTVTTIKDDAFSGNLLTSITIGANVELGWIDNSSAYHPSFDPGFDSAYNNGGKQAGTYIRLSINNGIWTNLNMSYKNE